MPVFTTSVPDATFNKMSAAAVVEAAATGSLLSTIGVSLGLVVATLVLAYNLYFLKHKRYYDTINKIPGPPGSPVVGHGLMFFGTAHETFKKLWALKDDFNKLIRVNFGPRVAILIADPRDIELILGSQVHLEKALEYRYFKQWLGDGLLISNGNHWRSHRKLIAPTFHLNVLKSFMTLFNKNARDTCVRMAKHNGKEFDCHDYMSECTVEILLETAMGVSKKTQNHNGFEYAMAVMKMCNIMHLRSTRPWLYFDFIFNFTNFRKMEHGLLDIIHNLTKKVIKQKKEEWASGVKRNLSTEDEDKVEVVAAKSSSEAASAHSFGQAAGLKDDLDVDDNDIGEKKRTAFLDLMVESAQNGVVMNDNDIKEEVDTIMFEGHDTTAAGSSFFLSMMAAHPHIQKKVIQELDEIFGDSDRPVTFQDTLEMKYLERCIMETLRMYPPVPFIARQIREDVKLVSADYTIPANTTVGIVTFLLHRLAEIYPNPEVFDPDNFLPERSANRHYYAYIPFSAGPRSCVGRKYAMLKLKVILSTILRNFHVKSTLQEKDFRLQGDIILKREEGFLISLEPRKSAFIQG